MLSACRLPGAQTSDGADTSEAVLERAVTAYSDAFLTGKLARATYTYSISAIDQESEPWVREGREWKQDDC